MSRVINERRGPITALQLVSSLSQAELDELCLAAATRLNRVLDGLEIDAPGEVGDALKSFRDACVKAGRT